MLPHSHFLIASLVIAPAAIALSPERSFIKIIQWILVGGFLSTAMDLDIYTLAFFKSKENKELRDFKNPIEIFRRFKHFMDTITKTGVLRIGMKTHLVFSVLVISLFYLFRRAYLIPAILGIASHIISDIPNLRRVG